MFSLNLDSREPIYEQLYSNVVKLVALGVLKPDEQLPTVRALAKDVGVNPNTVAKVYQMLERDNITYSVIGKGSFISPSASPEALKLSSAAQLINEALGKALEIGVTKDDINRIVKEYLEEEGGTL
ncbi:MULTISPECIES: GntR family transcriptional regulator [unclassified Ruminococcus]|uniref:GntR family transcriptional regulator n=1 Tax=unclassified Ruminococcus TaxID=2608920 RepID=UPI00210AF70A|nr:MULTISPECIES: GntR family transcriptional regulator [unclassified Ruminococcus]MCQ4022462.1 GntR family transcriptional regulator [Ruminococcus sp. zg-924]MCQ4115726.1 GntR family transcriptional regulator [Ruminococcus sp. zg-921]